MRGKRRQKAAEAELAVRSYLDRCAQLIQSGVATDELSFYPALNNLLDAVGALSKAPCTTIPNPAAKGEGFPDVGLYDPEAEVLVAPVEAKPPAVAKPALLSLPQAIRYAEGFGGGYVLLTNLWQFVWAQRTERGLQEISAVDLLAGPAALAETRPTPLPGAGQRLVELIEVACARRPLLSDADHIARLLALHAQRMAEEIEKAGDPKMLLRSVAESMRDGLGMHLEDRFFIPTVVQTLVYGLFAAWLDYPTPESFDHRDTAQVLHVPVIAEIFHFIQHPQFLQQCNLRPHLDHIAHTLQWIDRPAFTHQFDEFALEYFYEPFLARFDPYLRNKLGVWYTPKEIAQYQIRRVDHHLKNDLSLDMGLADDQVIVLDPAVGSGTYLVMALQAIYDFHRLNREPSEIAAARTKKAALTRVVGFEVLPAAFLISHLHVGRFLAQLGAGLEPEERPRIYLTNALTGWGSAPTAPPPTPLPGVEAEVAAALHVKQQEAVLVIIGNPPYEGFSAAEVEEEKKLLADWIEPLWPRYGLRKHRLGDLYVRFWRIAVRKIAELTGRGIVSYISNRKWLGGRSYPAMREYILQSFHTLVIDDLHGDVHDTSHPGDGSVFTTAIATGITRGVAITTCVRSGATSGIASVRKRDLRGSGEQKRATLSAYRGSSIDEGLVSLQPVLDDRWRLVQNSAGDDPPLDDYFAFFLSGVQPVRDEAVVDVAQEVLRQRMQDYFDETVTHKSLFAKHTGFAVERKRYSPKKTREKLFEDSAFEEGRIVPFLYRPLDARWLYWEPRHKLLNEPRRELMPYLLVSASEGLERIHDQIFLVAAQTPRRPGAARPAVSSGVPSFHCTDPDARAFPRLRPVAPSRVGEARSLRQQRLELGGSSRQFETNISTDWIRSARLCGVRGDDTQVGDCIFFSLVALMFAPSWIQSVGTDTDDFPTVPLPSNVASLAQAFEVGRRIAELMDPFSDVPGVTSGRLDSALATIAVPKLDHADWRLTSGSSRHGGKFHPGVNSGSIFWNPKGEWSNVPEEVWGYSVGGFQVLPKWLSYRHYSVIRRPLTFQEIETVTHLCRRIAALLKLEAQCERLFQLAATSPLTS